jgi:hypothetical protein
LLIYNDYDNANDIIKFYNLGATSNLSYPEIYPLKLSLLLSSNSTLYSYHFRRRTVSTRVFKVEYLEKSAEIRTAIYNIYNNSGNTNLSLLFSQPYNLRHKSQI